MPSLRIILCVVLLAFGSFAALFGEAPVVGMKRDEVTKTYGAPSGVIQAGTREVWRYAQGSITLADGHVVSSQWSDNPVPAPEQQPTARTTVRSKANTWLTDLDKAKREAAAGQKLILLFCPGGLCKFMPVFEKQVTENPLFFRWAENDFVLLSLDYRKADQVTEYGQAATGKLHKFGDVVFDLAPSRPLPLSMAVVSADGTRWALVNLDGVMEAKDPLAFTKSAIDSVKARDLPVHKNTPKIPWSTLGAISFGIVLLMWWIKRA